MDEFRRWTMIFFHGWTTLTADKIHMYSSHGPIPATNYDRHPKVDGRTANHTLADEVRPSRPDLSHYDLDLYIVSLTTE